MENTDDDSWHPLVEGDESRHDPMDRAAARDQRRFLTIALIGLAVLIALPFVVGDYYVSLFSEILIFGILVSGVNLLLGYTGLVSLGHASFMGLGAYVTAIAASLLGYPVWLSMLASILISLLIAYGVGLLSVRTKGVQFLLITLAFGQMFHAIAEKTRFTGGDDGMTNIPRIDLEFERRDEMRIVLIGNLPRRDERLAARRAGNGFDSDR